MGVYTYGTGAITPFPTGSGGTALGNGNLIVPFGLWTSVAIRVTGHWTGTAPASPASLVGGAFFNDGSIALAWSNVDVSQSAFDTGFQTQGIVSKYTTKQNIGKNSQYNVHGVGTTQTTTTIDSIIVQLTGVIPVPLGGGNGMPISKILGNLFIIPAPPFPNIPIPPNIPPTFPSPPGQQSPSASIFNPGIHPIIGSPAIPNEAEQELLGGGEEIYSKIKNALSFLRGKK